MSVNSFEHYALSWKPDPAALTAPRYLSLAGALERDILAGVLPPGTRLPPQRELADWLGINFTTVTRAWELCVQKNLIYGVIGRGTFVSPLPGEKTLSASESKSVPKIDLGTVKCFAAGQARIADAVSAVLSRGYLDRLFAGGERNGMPHQRAAGAHWMSLRGIVVDPDRCAIFAGAQNAISATLLSLFTLGDEIATDAFTYANLIGAARLAHVRLVPVPGDADGMDPKALDEICAKRTITGVFLMPVYAIPTGVTLSEKRKDLLAEVILRHGLTVIEDDAATVPPPSGYKTFFARCPEATVYISATHLAHGLRVSYTAVPEKFKTRLLAGLFHLNIQTSPLDAEIMTELVLSGQAERIIAEKHACAVAANRLFNDVFKIRNTSRDGHFFRTIDLPARAGDGGAVERKLSEKGVQVFHSSRFAVERSPARAFLRVSVSSAGSPSALKKGLCLLRDALPEL